MAFTEIKTKDEIAEERSIIVADKTLPLEIRKRAHQESLEAFLNPVSDEKFDPATFDPLSDDPDYDVKKRPRVAPPLRLPTKGLLPKQILEGQMIGMYESKQDLYLLIAYLWNKVADLEDQINGG